MRTVFNFNAGPAMLPPAVLEQAQEECEVLIWDGGNNDFPFYRPTVHLTVADPLRAGHETAYHPGETNFRMADVIVINKCDSATPEQIAEIERSAELLNPDAMVVRANSPVRLEDGTVKFSDDSRRQTKEMFLTQRFSRDVAKSICRLAR